MSDEPADRWGIGAWALVLAAFAVGFAGFPLRVVGTGGEYLPGDVVDNRLNNLILEHGYRCLASGRLDRFPHAPVFYPALGATGWSDAHLGMLPVYVLARAVGFSPEGAFQVYFLVPFLLNFAAAAWACRRLGFGPVGTAAAAYVFAFGLPLVAQLTHVQLFPRFLVPPAVVFAWEFLRTPRTRLLAAVAGCWAGQMYLTVYIGYFLALLLAAGGATAVVLLRRERPWEKLLRPAPGEWKGRIGVAIGTAAVVLPLVLLHALSVGGLPIDFLRALAPRPESWINPAELTAAHSLIRGDRNPEQQVFVGAIPLLAVAVGLVASVRRHQSGSVWTVAAVAAWSAVLLAVLVTRIGWWWPYEAVVWLPGASGVRATGRIVLVLLFPAALATAAMVDALVRVARGWGRAPGILVAVALLVAVAGDQWLAPEDGPRQPEWIPAHCPKARTIARQERIAAAIRRHPAPRLVYVMPSVGTPPFDGIILQLEAARAAQDLRLPCVNGYSGYFALEWDQFGDYRSLLRWLTATHHVSEQELTGLVVVGDPDPDPDPQYEAEMRAKYPPQPVAPAP